jgi:hypothetical protein
MCNQACVDFGQVNLHKEDVCGKTVIEIGAMDVNGSLRPHVESLGPSRYIGVDIEAGPGVDVICDAERLLAVFGPESFDVVISHGTHWNMCGIGGWFVATMHDEEAP